MSVKSSIRQLVAIVAVLLLVPVVVSAELTFDEKAQIQRLVSGVVYNISAAYGEISQAIGGKQDPPSILSPVSLALNSANREASQTLSALLDVVQSATWTPPTPETRSQRISQAWQHLDRVPFYLDQAAAWLGSANGANSIRAETIWIPSARRAALEINRTLAYADPMPFNGPQIIGPHGDYHRVQFELWRAWWYGADAVEIIMAPQDVALASSQAPTIIRAGNLYRAYADGLALMAGVVMRAQDESLSQFWRVLNYMQRLTDFRVVGVAQRYHEIQEAVAKNPTRFPGALPKISDSWRHMDNAVWQMLVFLDCTITQDPDGCARGQQPN